MIRIILLFLAVLVWSGDCLGQGSIFTHLKSDLKRADQLYKELAYAPAAELYQTVLGRSDQNEDAIKIKLGRCYYRLNKPEQSAYWYEQVLAKDSLLTDQDRINFAQSLSGSQQYDKAIEQYETLEPSDRTRAMMEALDSLEQFYQDSAYYQIAYLRMNTDAADFSPTYYQDGLVFASSRSQRSPVKRVYRWSQTPFLDLYYAPYDTSGQLGEVKKLTGQVNTKFHEGAVAFLDSGQKIIFTRNSFYNGRENLSSDRFNMLNLYAAERDGDSFTWKDIVPLPFNNEEYSTGHPTVTPDGKVLYFVSDAPGGVGGTDLYTSQYVDGRWSAPRNLGKTINTAGNEMFPYIHADGTLYFASDGHPGLGGLDIFRVLPHDRPRNVGYPVNTHRDDFGLIVDEAGRTGYFASNRRKGGVDDDLYTVGIELPPPLLVVSSATDEQSEEKLAGVAVALLAPDGRVIDRKMTDEYGNVRFQVPTDTTYTLAFSKEDYQPYEQLINPVVGSEDSLNVTSALVREQTTEDKRFAQEGSQSIEQQEDIVNGSSDDSDRKQAMSDRQPADKSEPDADNARTLAFSEDDNPSADGSTDSTIRPTDSRTLNDAGEKSRQVIKGRVTDENGQGAEGARILLLNRTTGATEDEMIVGEDGAYQFDLRPDQEYEIRAGKEQYLGSTEALSTKGSQGEPAAMNFVLNKVNLNEEVNLDIIYYDFDKWFIRTTAEKELDRLVALMKENSTYEVELGAHTDARGDDAYNQQLSQKRAQAAVDYIVKKGVDRNRITAKGYGEERIINGCTNGVPCSEAQHQENRRTEFTVVRE